MVLFDNDKDLQCFHLALQLHINLVLEKQLQRVLITETLPQTS